MPPHDPSLNKYTLPAGVFRELWKTFTWAEYWGQIAVWWGSWPPFWCIHSLFYRSYFILLALRWQFWLREAIFPAILPYCSRVTSRVTNYDNLCKVTTSHPVIDRKRFIFCTWQIIKFNCSGKFLLSNSIYAFRWKINRFLFSEPGVSLFHLRCETSGKGKKRSL